MAVVLLIVGVVGYGYAVRMYQYNTRYANSDQMGASIVFDQHWGLASLPTAAGLTAVLGLSFLWGVVFLVALVLAGIALKSTVLYPG